MMFLDQIDNLMYHCARNERVETTPAELMQSHIGLGTHKINTLSGLREMHKVSVVIARFAPRG
jgi:hypothetical protein